MEFFNTYNNEEPRKGDLLISEPFLPDPNFERTVVLLCEHNEDGSFGFILNKNSIFKFSDVMEEAESFDETVYVGGPVQQDTLHFLHRAGEVVDGGVEITKGLIWGGNFESLMTLIKTGRIDPNDFRFFLGYSGWSAGQLMEELQENSWILYRGVSPAHIFDTKPDNLWKEVLQVMGGKYKMFSNYPIDPRLN